ncbi:uncharacterized protein LOC133559917 isoform X2 [Nerophis ophidion]|uniref:uncharacterized protein LOC133559917 isoform X2 n=1 Tax=Nerophis ophidion TaxID=159077 RepID=UPI002AE081D6|nr:uncharacterized protein LOC133559917 isoform X2 [Nerophis ophidion]
MPRLMSEAIRHDNTSQSQVQGARRQDCMVFPVFAVCSAPQNAETHKRGEGGAIVAEGGEETTGNNDHESNEIDPERDEPPQQTQPQATESCAATSRKSRRARNWPYRLSRQYVY